MGDLRPSIDDALDAFDLPATVTRPSLAAVVTTGFWLSELLEEAPIGREYRKREPRRVFVMARDADLDTMPDGTLIAAAEMAGGEVKSWKKDGLAHPVESDTWRVIVVPA